MNRTILRNLAVFCLLVLVGVVGRLAQPAWCVTPLAAIALFSGFYFANRWAAILVPLAAMTVSDFWLPAYQHGGIMLAVYAAWLLPVVLGRSLRRSPTPARLCLFGPLPATCFWLLTNLAVWLFQGMYAHSAAGLIECYTAAIPFYRTMLAGDMLYLPVVFGTYFVACRWLAPDRSFRIVPAS